MLGLITDLAGLLNELNGNTLIFQFIGYSWEVLTLTCLLN